MKLLSSALVLLFSSASFAGSLVCTGERLSLSERHPDGGPAMMPTIQLVLNGDVMVDEGLDRPNTRTAYYGLNGKAVALKKPVKKGNFVTEYFKQQMSVNDTAATNPSMLFMGEVVCRRVTYVGVPIP